jgi:predicted secreted Zn-dependent protease
LRSVLLIVAGLAFAAQAPALEKCVGADGKVTYSDRGCGTGAKKASIASGSGASLAGAQMEYYDVAAPGGHMGRADWRLSYQLTTRTVPGGCAVASVNTKLELKVRLPRWTPAQGAPAELQQKWARYIAALEVHEAGHLQTGRDFEANFRRTASGMTAADCGSLGTALRSQFDSMLKQANTRDLDYDAQTRHGATQGAYFQ